MNGQNTITSYFSLSDSHSVSQHSQKSRKRKADNIEQLEPPVSKQPKKRGKRKETTNLPQTCLASNKQLLARQNQHLTQSGTWSPSSSASRMWTSQSATPGTISLPTPSTSKVSRFMPRSSSKRNSGMSRSTRVHSAPETQPSGDIAPDVFTAGSLLSPPPTNSSKRSLISHMPAWDARLSPPPCEVQATPTSPRGTSSLPTPDTAMRSVPRNFKPLSPPSSPSDVRLWNNGHLRSQSSEMLSFPRSGPSSHTSSWEIIPSSQTVLQTCSRICRSPSPPFGPKSQIRRKIPSLRFHTLEPELSSCRDQVPPTHLSSSPLAFVDGKRIIPSSQSQSLGSYFAGLSPSRMALASCGGRNPSVWSPLSTEPTVPSSQTVEEELAISHMAPPAPLTGPEVNGGVELSLLAETTKEIEESARERRSIEVTNTIDAETTATLSRSERVFSESTVALSAFQDDRECNAGHETHPFPDGTPAVSISYIANRPFCPTSLPLPISQLQWDLRTQTLRQNPERLLDASLVDNIDDDVGPQDMNHSGRIIMPFTHPRAYRDIIQATEIVQDTDATPALSEIHEVVEETPPTRHSTDHQLPSTPHQPPLASILPALLEARGDKNNPSQEEDEDDDYSATEPESDDFLVFDTIEHDLPVKFRQSHGVKARPVKLLGSHRKRLCTQEHDDDSETEPESDDIPPTITAIPHMLVDSDQIVMPSRKFEIVQANTSRPPKVNYQGEDPQTKPKSDDDLLDVLSAGSLRPQRRIALMHPLIGCEARATSGNTLTSSTQASSVISDTPLSIPKDYDAMSLDMGFCGMVSESLPSVAKDFLAMFSGHGSTEE